MRIVALYSKNFELIKNVKKTPPVVITKEINELNSKIFLSYSK
jgi:hypothetical protein